MSANKPNSLNFEGLYKFLPFFFFLIKIQSFLRITVWHVLPFGKTAKQISYKKYL